MDQLLALAVAVPLLAAAAISAAAAAARRPPPGPRRGGHRGRRVRRRHAGGHHGPDGRRRPGLLVRRIPPGPRHRDRDRLRGGLAQRRPGQPGRGAGDRGDDLLLAVLRAGRHLLPRADADLPGGHGRLLPHRGHLRHVRVVRADGGGGLRADRLPARGTRADPGRAQLRHHQQRRRLPVAVRHRADLRPHRSAQHGPDRRPHRPPPARRAGHGGVPADHLGPADQERDRAVPLLARRRARGGADTGLRAVLRRDGGTRPVRDRPGLLVDVRPGARAPGRDLARVPGPGRADGRGRGVVLLPRAAHQAAARVLHHQPRGHVPGRHRPADAARPGRQPPST